VSREMMATPRGKSTNARTYGFVRHDPNDVVPRSVG